MLYNHTSRVNHLHMSQAALLLSYWCPAGSPDEEKPKSTSWLRAAIGHARAIRADAYGDGESDKREINSDDQYYDSSYLKNLWWCCIIRDRIMSLCFRQPIQIRRTDFDFATKKPPGLSDLNSGLDDSEAYSLQSKDLIAGITALLAELCVHLTDTLDLVYGESGGDAFSDAHGCFTKRLHFAKDHLRIWHKTASSNLSGWEDGLPEIAEDERHMITLWTNLLWIYYE